MLRYPEGLKSATPSELYIKIRNNMKLDLHVTMRDKKIRQPLELYIEMGNNMSDIFISS